MAKKIKVGGVPSWMGNFPFPPDKETIKDIGLTENKEAKNETVLLNFIVEGR